LPCISFSFHPGQRCLYLIHYLFRPPELFPDELLLPEDELLPLDELLPDEPELLWPL